MTTPRVTVIAAASALAALVLSACGGWEAPSFTVATNDPSVTGGACPCQELQAGRTDCRSIDSFYVFFKESPARGPAQAIEATVRWVQPDRTAPVPEADLVGPSQKVCGQSGWGVHVKPPALFPGTSYGAGDNSYEVSVRMYYGFWGGWSLWAHRVIFFLG